MTPIAQLDHEHQVIRSALQLLEMVRDTIRQQGTVASPGNILSLLDFFEHYVDHMHHGKEESYLFPELEKIGVSKELGPIGVMLREHESGRQLIRAIRVQLLTPGNPSLDLQPLLAWITDYTELLNRHIEKESTVLFQIALKHLSQSCLETMQVNFNKVTSDHWADYEHYPRLIDSWQKALRQEPAVKKNK